MSSEEIIDTFTARKGDRLDSIAFKFYGSEDFVKELYDANPEVAARDSLLLLAGDQIKLPKIDATRVLQKSEFNLFGA